HFLLTVPGPAILWSTVSGREEGRVDTSTLGEIHSAAFSPDGRRMVALNFNTSEGEISTPLTSSNNAQAKVYLKSLAFGRHPEFSPDGRRILTQGNSIAKLWDAVTGQDVLTLKTLPFSPCTFSPDGQSILSGRADGSVQRWETATAAQLAAWDEEAA